MSAAFALRVRAELASFPLDIALESRAPRLGSMTAHFISNSGVTSLNSRATTAR